MTFIVDLRAIDDMGREAGIYELSNQMYKICERCSVSCIIDRKVWDFISLCISFVTLISNNLVCCGHFSMMQMQWFVILN